MGVAPDQQQNIQTITRNFTLAAGVAQQIVPANNGRRFLLIQNTGINPLTLKEDAAPTAAAGMGLDPATSAGGQGGSWNPTEVVPTNAYWAISTVGTTVISVEG